MVSRQRELADGTVGKLPFEEVLDVGTTYCSSHFRHKAMGDKCDNSARTIRVQIAEALRDALEDFIDRFSVRWS